VPEIEAVSATAAEWATVMGRATEVVSVTAEAPATEAARATAEV
jgi:hypothetical protein